MKVLAMDSTSNSSPLINLLPERPGQRDCAFFLRTGTCRFGSNCRFNHPGLDQRQIMEANHMQVSPYGLQKPELPERIGQPECQFYLKTGTCKFGAQCKYHHPQLKGGRGPPQLNYLGLPIRLGEKECVYYLRTGTCKFGISCKFHHPEPAGIGTMFPSLSPLYSNGALVSPIPIPSWSMVRPAYLAASGFPGPSPYMHVYASSPQSIPMTGWNSYQSPNSHVTLDGQQMEYGNGIQANGGWKSNSEESIPLPQRSGQPDCHFYMKTGLCKFGTNCKYHHPKDITIPSLPASMSPMGLPLRPGMPLCTFYLKNGVCKFGPICKFDHPIGPLPSMPTVSLLPRNKESSRADDLSSNDEGQTSPGQSPPVENGRCDDIMAESHEEQHQNNHGGKVTEHTTE